MNKLILFDIDGTLVKSIPGNPHALAFTASIKSLYGLDAELDWGGVAGMTDRLIFLDILEKTGWSKDKVFAEMPKLVAELERIYVADFVPGSVQLCTGVESLLSMLEKQGVELGLLTGNLKAIARTKLEDAGIYHYFKLGGFGSDEHTARSQLVTIAAHRAGLQNELSNVYLVGDTPRDISAARDAGVNHTIGVATGHHTVEALIEAQAEIALESLEESQKFLDFINQ